MQWRASLADLRARFFRGGGPERSLALRRWVWLAALPPVLAVAWNGGLWLESIAAIGCDAVGLDWTMDIGRARRLVGDKVALQGNLDPNVLFAPPEAVATETRRVLDAFGNHPGHVFNLGHGISQYTPPESVSVLVDTVHAHSRAIRAGA